MEQESRPFVLFADDDKSVLELFQYYAKQRNFRADYVLSGREIIEKVNSVCGGDNPCYDIIVSDINYFDRSNQPDVTGISAARELRKNDFNLPILFVSAYGSALIREEVRKVGGDLILKPFDFDELFDRIQYLVEYFRLSVSKNYKGRDRRRSGENSTANRRRNTDNNLRLPLVLERTIMDARKER